MNRQLLQQEPVAEVYRFHLGGHARSIGVDDVRKLKGVALPPPGTKLYAAPVATEPYGHVTTHTVTGQQFFYRYPSPPYLDTAKECIAVYAAPPAAPAPAAPVVREPLTDKQILSMWRSSKFRGNGGQADWFCEGIRAAEAHHGITGASK